MHRERPTVRDRDAFFASLPTPWPGDLAAEIAAGVRTSKRKIVVLDDDPTGTQTVHGVFVLASWSEAELCQALAEPEPAFYILTNSRSLPGAEAAALNVQIARQLAAASRATGREFVLVSRSDSTLRGHFPAEVDALAETLEAELRLRFDGVLIVPFFLEGGRYTVGDVHWVQQGEQLVPAADTEFARDPAFGYRESFLPAWVEEKTAGRIPAEKVLTIPLEMLRAGGPTAVRSLLAGAHDRVPVVANAACYGDLEVLVAGLLEAEHAGKRFLYRTAASFVRVRSALPARGFLGPKDLFGAERRRAPGLVIVGSHVRRTSEQLEALLELPGTRSLEVSVPAVLHAAHRERQAQALAEAALQGMARGDDIVLATSRAVALGSTPEGQLSIGQAVSDALCDVTRRVVGRLCPGYVIAKGGITSSDIATRALGIRRALVLGQIQPGVPVWQAGPESIIAGVPYVVFPGNVGTRDTLRLIVEACRPGC